jgi:predicted ATPase
VLAPAGRESEPGVPFGMFVDALDDHVAALGAEHVRRASRDRQGELAAMLPALAGAATGTSPALGDERYRLHYAARGLLEGLADARPLLLALDDVHWADAASLELVAHLVRRPPSAPFLLVLSLRPAQAPPRLARALRAAARDGGAVQVALGPLSREDADALIADRVPASRRGALYERSGGNPLFLDALARHPQDGSVPETVLAALSDELGALSAPALELARGAAVAGEPFGPELAAAAAELAEPAALAALDELLRAELVAGTDLPRQFRFRHPILRQAIYAEAGAGWRLGAHERAAAALARQGAAPALRAPSRALRPSGRPGRSRAAGQRRRRGGRAGAGGRGALVDRRAAPASGRHGCR